MAIEPIEKLTRPLSRKEEKRVAWDAPEDYLKRAVEQFIIEFPEFEDLPSEELYKEMEKKGWFSDQYASGPDPNDMSGWYEMYDDLRERGELPDWMNSFELFMENLDVLDISPWDFVQRKGKKDIRRVNQGGIIGLRFGGDPRTEQRSQGIMQLASHTGEDVIQSAILWAAGLPQFGSIDAVVQSLQDGSTDINGLVNAYMDARTEMN